MARQLIEWEVSGDGLRGSMTEQLQEMKARLEAATPGPWVKDPDEPVHIMRPDKPGSCWDGTVIATLQRDDFGLFEEANADLIAHAPETQAKLIAALEAVEALAKGARRMVTFTGATVSGVVVADDVLAAIAKALA